LFEVSFIVFPFSFFSLQRRLVLNEIRFSKKKQKKNKLTNQRNYNKLNSHLISTQIKKMRFFLCV